MPATTTILRSLILTLSFTLPLRSAVIVPVNGSAPDERTYPQLASDWWEWAASIPAPQSPLLDTDGIYAGLGQTGNVFFLAPSIGGEFTRFINVPPDAYLFFPIITSLFVNGPDETYTEDEMHVIIGDLFDRASVLYVTINGEQLPNVWTYRATTAAGLSVTLPDDNIFGVDSGLYTPAAADGWWLLMEPLEPGTHVIHFEGGIGDPNNVTWYQAVTYHITTPEPAALTLLLAGAPLVTWRRRRSLEL
jgi:hypothetical protein